MNFINNIFGGLLKKDQPTKIPTEPKPIEKQTTTTNISTTTNTKMVEKPKKVEKHSNVEKPTKKNVVVENKKTKPDGANIDKITAEKNHDAFQKLLILVGFAPDEAKAEEIAKQPVIIDKLKETKISKVLLDAINNGMVLGAGGGKEITAADINDFNGTIERYARHMGVSIERAVMDYNEAKGFRMEDLDIMDKASDEITSRIGISKGSKGADVFNAIGKFDMQFQPAMKNYLADIGVANNNTKISEEQFEKIRLRLSAFILISRLSEETQKKVYKTEKKLGVFDKEINLDNILDYLLKETKENKTDKVEKKTEKMHEVKKEEKTVEKPKVEDKKKEDIVGQDEVYKEALSQARTAANASILGKRMNLIKKFVAAYNSLTDQTQKTKLVDEIKKLSGPYKNELLTAIGVK